MDIGSLFINQKIGFFEEYEKNKEYTEVLSNGVFKVYSDAYFSIRYKTCNLKANSLVGNIPDGVEYINTVSKLPRKYLEMLISFYREVNNLYKTEASLVVYYNHNNLDIPKEFLTKYKDLMIIDGNYVILVPYQINNSVHSNFYSLSSDFIDWLEANMLGVLETHSHNVMPAFWSSEDDRNERGSIIRWYLVVGNLDLEKPSIEVRLNYNGNFLLNKSVSDVFESESDNILSDENTRYPEKWLLALK